MGNRIRRPCLDCHQPTTSSRCPPCTQRRDRVVRAHYAGDYKQRAALLKQKHPQGPCHLCGHPILNPTEWSAHHVDPSNPASPLAPAHLDCNQSYGTGGGG